MRLADCNRLALGAVLRAPLRTAMMLLATAIGVGSVLLLTSLGESPAFINGFVNAMNVARPKIFSWVILAFALMLYSGSMPKDTLL